MDFYFIFSNFLIQKIWPKFPNFSTINKFYNREKNSKFSQLFVEKTTIFLQTTKHYYGLCDLQEVSGYQQ